jgi:hypothetical protein
VLRRFTAAFAFCVLCATASFAQSSPSASSPPSPLRGFVPPYEILRTLRAAGFEPLGPPLREGTTYVVRAIDYRGVPMRVAVDARSGAIRDANRIVAGLYGPYVPGPYAPAYYGRLPAPPYPGGNDIDSGYMRPPIGTSELPTGDRHSIGLVPLPRARPANLAVANDNKSVARPDVAIGAPGVTQPGLSREPGKGAAVPAIND